MKTVTLLMSKGGACKSTIATHLAAGLAIKGNRVLLIDTDPQGNASIAMGLDKQPHFYDLTVRESRWQDVVRPVHPDVYGERDNAPTGELWMVTGNKESRHVPMGMSSNSYLLKRTRELRGRFDYVVFDTGPTPSLLQASITAATDYVLIPSDCEPFGSLDSLYETIEDVNSVNASAREAGYDYGRVLGIIPTKYRDNTLTHSNVLETINNDFGSLVWEPIPHSIIYAEAQLVRQFLYGYAPGHSATAYMWQIVDKVLNAQVVLNEQV